MKKDAIDFVEFYQINTRQPYYIGKESPLSDIEKDIAEAQEHPQHLDYLKKHWDMKGAATGLTLPLEAIDKNEIYLFPTIVVKGSVLDNNVVAEHNMDPDQTFHVKPFAIIHGHVYNRSFTFKSNIRDTMRGIFTTRLLSLPYTIIYYDGIHDEFVEDNLTHITKSDMSIDNVEYKNGDERVMWHDGFENLYSNTFEIAADFPALKFKRPNVIHPKPQIDLIEKDNSKWGMNPHYLHDFKLLDDNNITNMGKKLYSNKDRISMLVENQIFVNDINDRPLNVLHNKLSRDSYPAGLYMQDPTTVKNFINIIGEDPMYYDFESYTMPKLIHFKDYDRQSYGAIISQLSLMTKNRSEDYVYDPLTSSLADNRHIVETLYSHNGNFVVYNKAFENTRLKEMYMLDPTLKDMVESIVERTYDLFDLFKVTTPHKVPPVFIHGSGGKASIKNIEPFLEGVKSYKGLEVSNGLEAMYEAIKRFRGDDWDVDSLKEYCHNDVIVMVKIIEKLKSMLNERGGE